MSSDNGIRLHQLPNGKWIGYMYFASADDNDSKLSVGDANYTYLMSERSNNKRYNNLEDITQAYRDAAAETEYGFDIVPFKPKDDREATPKELAYFYVDSVPLGYDEKTLHKVYKAFLDNGITDMQVVIGVINTMQNSGILFRENVK